MIFNKSIELKWELYKCIKPFKVGLRNNVHVKKDDIFEMALFGGIAFISLSDDDGIEYGETENKVIKRCEKINLLKIWKGNKK